MKLYGIALIMLASLWVSAQSVSVRRQHAETLGQFCLLLERLAGEIRIDAKPMPELLQSLVSRSGDSAEKFLDYLCTSLEKLGECSFSKLWEDALLVIPELHPDEIRLSAGLLHLLQLRQGPGMGLQPGSDALPIQARVPLHMGLEPQL